MNLDHFFNPKAVAIFGLSDKPGNLGRNIIVNCRRWGYRGRIFGVNPKRSNCLGVEIFPSLAELPVVPDLAMVLTRADLLPKILLECARAGVRRVAVTSAGFEEIEGQQGRALTEQILGILRQHKIRLLGPNGIACADAHSGLCLPFMPVPVPRPGNIAVLAQSGGVGTTLLETMVNDSIPVSKFVSLGNKTDLDEADFLEYLAGDEQTEIICFYLEGFKRGREFLAQAGRMTKPILLFMGNLTPFSRQAAISHTAALAGDSRMLAGALRQAGVIQVPELYQMPALAKAFNLPAMKGPNLLIMSPSGGNSVVIADLAYRYGFQMPPLPPDLVKKYSGERRTGLIEFRNPLDFGDLYDAKVQLAFLREALARPEYDGLIAAYPYRDEQMHKDFDTLGNLRRDLIAQFGETVELTGKPAAFITMIPNEIKTQEFARGRAPVFDRLEDAVGCLAALREHDRKVERLRKNQKP